MIFTKSSDIPKGVNEALQDVANFSAGMHIQELVQTISQRLTKLLATGSQADPLSIDDDDSDVQMLDGAEDGADEAEEESEEDYGAGFDSEDDDFGYVGGKASTSSYRLSPEVATKLNRRIKEDLRAVKFAGFKLGILSGLTAESQTSVLSISIQAAKLGLSDEAIQAWDLEPNQYIVLLIRYSAGYKTFNSVIDEPAKSLDISFRIGVCNKYKPTTAEALAAFTEVTKDEDKASDSDKNKDGSPKSSGFSSIFISSSLNEFINDQFISLLKIRGSTGIGWDGAKLFFNDRQGRWSSDDSALPQQYYEESKPKQTSLADMMYADHLVDGLTELSFPLIAAQFAMRYLLRCTEFCLVCHDRIEGDFEALKPYVCDKPLCLYQYMSLGFGPSVEHEILTQPYVVDLLVSFCYAASHVSSQISLHLTHN
jgi:ubiquitin-conjugating enzyme E2 Q